MANYPYAQANINSESHLNLPHNGEPSPYGSGAAFYGQNGYSSSHAPQPKKGTSKWLKIGLPVAGLIIAGVVVGVVLALKHNNSSSSASSSTSGNAATGSNQADGANGNLGIFPTGTDSLYMLPLYPTTTNTALFTSPTFSSPSNDNSWPADPFQPANPSVTAVRQDRPRLIAPSYKWDALPKLIESNPYMKSWNDTIFGNATDYYALPVVKYFMDGDSGILDNGRELKMRIKAFAYVYRMTKDTKWADRAFKELQNAAGTGPTPFGPNSTTTEMWNPTHFLDTAEFSAAFGIAYDWLYDVLTDDQKTQIRSALITYGLNLGIVAYSNSDNRYTGWWTQNIYGNWNCVCNGGLTLGALAILDDDTTGVAQQILSLTVDNAKANCAFAVSSDGSWAETANYWYFGTTGFAELASALTTATGSDYGLLNVNPNFYKTGLFHIAITGPGSRFIWGDHGPNMFSTTANGMFLFGQAYNRPDYQLFQRDQADAAEPWSMFWYNPLASGAWWDGLAIDNFFTNETDQWAAMRSSWTDENSLYVGIKAGTNVGHQTHNDLDVGDFVLDAMGVRWAGELGSGDYRSFEYFKSDAQDATRWLYYRKRTEGQNTILVNKQNQLVTAQPNLLQTTSKGTKQGSSPVLDIAKDDAALFVADITSAYENVDSFKRGVRLLNGRKQVLLQDDINTTGTIMWRMHTNATVDVSGTSATLKIDDKVMQMSILNPPDGVSITTGPAVRFDDDPQLPPGQTDQENPGVTVVMINLPAGQASLQVLFNPQWEGMPSGDFVMPPSFPLDQWSLTSHN